MARTVSADQEPRADQASMCIILSSSANKPGRRLVARRYRWGSDRSGKVTNLPKSDSGAAHITTKIAVYEPTPVGRQALP